MLIHVSAWQPRLMATETGGRKMARKYRRMSDVDELQKEARVAASDTGDPVLPPSSILTLAWPCCSLLSRRLEVAVEDQNRMGNEESSWAVAMKSTRRGWLSEHSFGGLRTDHANDVTTRARRGAPTRARVRLN